MPKNMKKEAMQTLDVQMGLTNFFSSEEGLKFCHGFSFSVIRDAPNEPEPMWESDEQAWRAAERTGTQVCANLAVTMRDGTTYIMTEDMMSLTMKAAESVPRTPFHEDDLPARHGFCMLPYPMVMLDIHGRKMTAKAFAWWSGNITYSTASKIDEELDLDVFRSGDDKGHPALAMAFFCDKHDWREDYYLGKEHEETPEYWARMPRFQLTHWQPIEYGEAWWTEAPPAPENVIYNDGDGTEWEIAQAMKASSDWSAMLKSFFLLVKQEIAVLHHQHLDRAHQRRLARAKVNFDDSIQIVTLRKERPDSPEQVTDGTPVNWSHRWIVSGFWRNQWYPSKNRHEPIWINSYEKGPKDKPLIVKDKVFVWRR